MESTHVGRLGLVVSRLCLGTMNFGPHTPRSRLAPRSWIRRSSTASTSSTPPTSTAGTGRRHDRADHRPVVREGRWSARQGRAGDEGVRRRWATGRTSRRLSALAIRKACEARCARLQTDHIDLYQMHHIDRDTPWDEIWQAMELLVQQGKVLYVGSVNFAGWHIAQANELARSAGTSWAWCPSRACTTCNARTVELEVLPACSEYGMGVIPWSPLGRRPARRRAAEGHRGPPRRPTTCRRRSSAYARQLEKLREQLCAELGDATRRRRAGVAAAPTRP